MEGCWGGGGVRGGTGAAVVEGTYQLLIFGIAEKFLEIGIVVLAAVEAAEAGVLEVSGQLSY